MIYKITLTEREFYDLGGLMNAEIKHLETLINAHEKCEYGRDSKKIKYLKSQLKIARELRIKIANTPF